MFDRFARVVAGYILGIGRENRLRDEGKAGIVEGDDDGAEVGDRSRDFRYIL